MTAAEIEQAAREYFEERAAIMEYMGGGMSRREAERCARAETAAYRAALLKGCEHGEGSYGRDEVPGMRLC